MTHKERLIAIYKAKNPDMLPKVDDLLQKYDGKEEELFSKLSAKYSGAGKKRTIPSGPSLGSSRLKAPTASPKWKGVSLSTTPGNADMWVLRKQVH